MDDSGYDGLLIDRKGRIDDVGKSIRGEFWERRNGDQGTDLALDNVKVNGKAFSLER